MTVLGTAPSVVGVEQGESALDAAGHRYFFLGSDGTGTSYVYVMNTQTGQQIAALAAGFSGGLQFDPGSGDLFGLRHNPTQKVEEFCTEDPTTGTVTVLGTAPSVVGVEQGESALDAAGHRYFFLGSDGTGTSYVYVMNTQTGQQIAALAAGFSGGLQFAPQQNGTPSASLEGVGLTLDYVQINADGSKTDLHSTAPTGAGSYTVTAAFAGSADYAAASKTVAFTISKAKPAFSNLSSPSSIVHGTAATTFSGELSVNGLFPTGMLTVTLTGPNGATASGSASLNANGSFSVIVTTGSLPAGSYTITYGYIDSGDADDSGGADFTPATDKTSKLRIT